MAKGKKKGRIDRYIAKEGEFEIIKKKDRKKKK
jgi:hypothetical protein